MLIKTKNKNKQNKLFFFGPKMSTGPNVTLWARSEKNNGL